MTINSFIQRSAVTGMALFMAGTSLSGSVQAGMISKPDLNAPRPAFIQVIDQTAENTGPMAGARHFVDSMAKNAVDFLADQSLSEAQKKSRFRSLLFTDFDMDTIGRFSLGSYWNSTSPAQRQEYLSLFREMIAKVYAQRFESYNGQKFEVRSSRADGEKDTLVSSVIVPNDKPEVQVDWRVRYKDGHYKVVDVVVEGVSMAVTQRSDFSSVIQQGGGDIKVLLDHLRQPVQADSQL